MRKIAVLGKKGVQEIEEAIARVPQTQKKLAELSKFNQGLMFDLIQPSLREHAQKRANGFSPGFVGRVEGMLFQVNSSLNNVETLAKKNLEDLGKIQQFDNLCRVSGKPFLPDGIREHAKSLIKQAKTALEDVKGSRQLLIEAFPFLKIQTSEKLLM